MRNEFPLDLIDVCGICEENHPTIKNSSFPGLKDTFRREKENMESLYFINQKRLGELRPFLLKILMHIIIKFLINLGITHNIGKNPNPCLYQGPPISPPYQSFPRMPQKSVESTITRMEATKFRTICITTSSSSKQHYSKQCSS
jgi:hypothetical protein